MLYPRSLTPNGLDREMGKNSSPIFLGRISRSARVIFFERARLAHQRSGDRFVAAFDLGLATGTNEMRIAVKETGHASAASHANFQLLRSFPSVHPPRMGKPAFRLGRSESLFDRRSSWTGVPKDGVAP
jgi:hypothetical protein